MKELLEQWKFLSNAATSNEYAGSYCGIGSFRPTKSGLFGRFELIDLKPTTP